MKKIASVMAVFLGCVLVVSAGENLLKNGDFKLLKGANAQSWSNTGKVSAVFAAEGGPGNAAFVKFDGTGATEPKYEISVRQNLTGVIEAGKKYRVSVMVKGTDFKSKSYGILIISEGWKKSAGLRLFKVTPEWALVSGEFIAPAAEKIHQMVIYAVNSTGILEVADVKLEAL